MGHIAEAGFDHADRRLSCGVAVTAKW